jgi:hypothetical protein
MLHVKFQSWYYLFQVNLLISVIVLSYALAIPICLFIELPVLQLWRATYRKPESPRTSPDVETPQAVKTRGHVDNINGHDRMYRQETIVSSM